MKTNFIFNRLRAMTPLELVYRLKQRGQLYFEKVNYTNYRFNDRVIRYPAALFQEIELRDDLRKQLLAQADLICNNRINILALRECDFGASINYHKDYQSGRVIESTALGKSIDYRDPVRVGNVKYVWEVNRLLFLLPLALAYRVTGRERYLNQFCNLLNQWLIQNPLMEGINWASSLELAIRLINWAFCWQLLASDVNGEIRQQWIKSIYAHCWFIRNNLSLFSSANNHLIGELTGLFIASIALPEFNDSKKWRDFSFWHLVQECFKQNYEDGVNKEQSVYYQHYTTEYLMLAGLIGERYGQVFPENFWRALQKSFLFLGSIIDANGNIFTFGDEDGGVAIDLGQRQFGLYQSLLNTACYIFDCREFSNREQDLKTWFYSNFIPKSKKFRVEQQVSQFTRGGYYLLGRDFGKLTEQKACFDCGPLGYLTLAAHGHSDALSFCLSVEGKPIFVDPGTYSYTSQGRWRDYFRSTKAHNTVTIDDLDQSVITGSFLWGRKANATLLDYQENRLVKGWHDGYLRLPDKVKHIRELKYEVELNHWTILDILECKQKHQIKICFHLHPDCEVINTKNELLIINGNIGCRMVIPKQCTATVYCGSNEPRMGWHSPAYDIIQKTKSIVLQSTFFGSTEFRTDFYITHNMEGWM